MPGNDLDLLVEAARAGAEIAVGHWQSGQTVWDKGAGAGPVSEGDLAVDRFLRETLTAARPDYGWLSEETEDDRARLAARRVFVVDPIDGTRAYVDGQETWALSLAVVEDGRPLAAAVLLPLRDKLYTAAAGVGAALNGAQIAATPGGTLSGATLLTPRGNLDPVHWPRGVPAVERHFRPSLAYRLCLVAEGRFDAMLTLRNAWEWDIAAGALVAAEAGARVTDRDGRALHFNSADAHTKGVLAAAPALHRQLSDGLGVRAA